ncbi:MAG: DNA repair protein RecO [Rubrivivax sp.]|nr:DNA repair protein RecO [Rubrivivax sp.]
MATHRTAPPLAAYVLHSYDWSESSLVLDLFTRSQGRVVAIAKGAKRPTSGFRPLLLPFHPLSVWLSRQPADEQGEVRTVRAAEWVGGVPLPVAALLSGFYLNELLMKSLPRQDPHPALFDAYADTLAALAALGPGRGDAAVAAGAASAEADAALLRAFELVLLRECGWLPELDSVAASAEPLVAERRYTLRPESGVVADSAGVPGRTWVAVQAALQHGSLGALRQACAVRAAEGSVLRAALRNLVHYHLSTPQLRTRRLGQQMQRLAADPADQDLPDR